MAYQMAGSDIEWPWRSFTGCRPFQAQSVEHLCISLHDFNWQCANGASAL